MDEAGERDPLVQGMFSRRHQTANTDPSNRFGLQEEQIESLGRIIKNAGWYNAHGEKLGWGDLNVIHIARVAKELQSDEMFVVLTEEDSYARFVKKPSAYGGFAVITEVEKELLDEQLGRPSGFGNKDEIGESYPGSEYIGAYGEFAVVRDGLLFCRDSRKSSFETALEKIPAILKDISNRLEVIAHHFGKEEFKKFERMLWPGDDIQANAEKLPLEEVDRPEFFLRVVQFAHDNPQTNV